MKESGQSPALPHARYLVTGGCGFIGSHLVERLVRQNLQVRVLDNLSSGHLRHLAAVREAIDFVEGDVRDRDVLQRALRDTDIVFHQAALVSVPASVERPEENHATNLTGTLNLLEAARAAGTKRVVFASSAALYGNDPQLPKTEDLTPRPESPYAIAKLAGEHYLRIFAQLYGLETVSLRYFNVYGPRQDPRSPYSGVISRFIDALARDQAPTVFGDGQQSRDLVYVSDVVQANLRAAALPDARGDVFNIATGRATTLLQLAQALAKITGRLQPPRHEPARAGDIRHSLADITQASTRLGFAPAFPLTEGLTALWRSLTSTP